MDQHQTQYGAELIEELEHVLKMRSKYCLIFVRNFLNAIITVITSFMSDLTEKSLTVLTLNIVGGFGELAISKIIKSRGRKIRDREANENGPRPAEFRSGIAPIQ